MKTFFRVLIILVIASIIGGMMYVGVNASSSATGSANFEEGGERPSLPEGAEFRPEGDREERDGGFGFPVGVLKALVLMSIAGGAYSAVVLAGKKAKQVTSS